MDFKNVLIIVTSNILGPSPTNSYTLKLMGLCARMKAWATTVLWPDPGPNSIL